LPSTSWLKSKQSKNQQMNYSLLQRRFQLSVTSVSLLLIYRDEILYYIYGRVRKDAISLELKFFNIQHANG
jgi:hypothetical protein